MKETNVIKAESLTKMFGDFTAVNAINFEVAKGEIRFWLDDDEQPFLTSNDKSPIGGDGHIGIRAWGGAVRTDTAMARAAVVSWPPPAADSP